MTSHEGHNVYFDRRHIEFYEDSFGFIFVKTDKPIYKPSQTGKCPYLSGVLISGGGVMSVCCRQPIYYSYSIRTRRYWSYVCPGYGTKTIKFGFPTSDLYKIKEM